MVGRILVVVVVVASIVTAMWALGLFSGVVPDPPYDPPLDDILPDGIAEVYGTVYDAAGNPLTFVQVKCGGETDYTLGESTYSLQITLDQGAYALTSCLGSAYKSGYYTASQTVPLSDLIPIQVDFFLEDAP